jgi:Ras-related GTP-binding protein A/B
VAVLIFVFDIASKEAAPDMLSFASTIRALREYSPNSKIFVLVHKMDLVPLEQKGSLYGQKVDDIRATCQDEGFTGKQVDISPSSIWDQSLYRAWTQVIYFLVPNATVIEGMLQKLAELLEAREMILYERTTCLVVTHITRGSEARNPYTDRFERISSILKTHKHSMSKHTGMMPSDVSFAEMQIKTGAFMFFITRLTENTNLAVVMPSDEASFNAARVNVQLARQEFAHLDIVEKRGKDGQAAYREFATREDERGSEDSDLATPAQTQTQTRGNNDG